MMMMMMMPHSLRNYIGVPVLAMADWFSVWSPEAPLGFCDLIGTRKV